MGFTKKSARQFFEILTANKIDLLLDIRLNNKSQLAGFSKGEDLMYFLKEICDCAYDHYLELAPTKEILDAYKRKQISWAEYAISYAALIEERDAVKTFFSRYADYQNIVLLCSEPTADQCHRRLAAEKIVDSNSNISITHI
jgi:uncharacterized protein YeaO (DUF488 family)